MAAFVAQGEAARRYLAWRARKEISCPRSLLLDQFAAEAVDELLLDPAGGVVRFLFMTEQQKGLAKLGMQLAGAIAHDRKTAAFLRAILGKSSHYHQPTRLDRMQHLTHIGMSVFSLVRK